MIFESSPWKQDLRKRKNLIIKYNTADHFEKNDDATYTGFAGQAKISVYNAVFFFSYADPSSREDAGNPSMTREIALPRKNIADRSAISNFMI